MELPRRERGDELLKPGEMTAKREALRRLARRHDLTAVIACAFDHRTRMLPFIFADKRMAPAGVRAIGSAMVDAGFAKTRIVLQQWNRNFRPSRMRVDGRIPDLFMVSSMQIHTAECHALIKDACRIDLKHRPLIIAGGAKVVYEPWDVFGADPNDPWGADVAVTGEEYVLLSLLELLLSMKSEGESLRSTFLRVRDSGLLDAIPGLMYPLGDAGGRPAELVNTGVQRLLGDLDELPDPVLGYGVLEAPSRGEELAAQPLPANLVRKYSPISSLVLTFGCKFACPYCPIPAYNQRQHRVKSGARIAEEFTRLNDIYGLRYYFGADDNFFNSKERTLDIVETLSRSRKDRKPFRKHVRWGTEVTVHDTLQLAEYMPLMRNAGIRALWLGVEDMTATLVKKGQSVSKTEEAFRLMQKHGICPMPMMMHHDKQPLYTPGSPYGLINQVRMLRRAGAPSVQVLMMTPATGSKLYEEAFTSGLAYESVDGRKVENYMLDANYVVASDHPKPWKKQFNIMLNYLYFYNPLRFAWAIVRPRTKLYLADAGMQVIGMWGAALTVRRTLGWAFRLMRGGIRRKTAPPKSAIPIRELPLSPEQGRVEFVTINPPSPASLGRLPIHPATATLRTNVVSER